MHTSTRNEIVRWGSPCAFPMNSNQRLRLLLLSTAQQVWLLVVNWQTRIPKQHHVVLWYLPMPWLHFSFSSPGRPHDPSRRYCANRATSQTNAASEFPSPRGLYIFFLAGNTPCWRHLGPQLGVALEVSFSHTQAALSGRGIRHAHTWTAVTQTIFAAELLGAVLFSVPARLFIGPDDAKMGCRGRTWPYPPLVMCISRRIDRVGYSSHKA
jgi:hypothetical protein